MITLPLETKVSTGSVKLLDMMPHPATGTNPDQAIVNAARVSFDDTSKGLEKDTRLLNYLMRHSHTSPFEMVELKFLIEAPIVVFWQGLRHRKLTFMNINAVSGRYVSYDETVYIPRIFRKQSKSNKQGSEGISERSSYYHDLMRGHVNTSMRYYQSMLDDGIAREQARFILPAFALTTKWMVKGDLWNWMQFCRLRTHPTAQAEIREYGVVIWDILRAIAPITTKAYQKYMNLMDRITQEWEQEGS